MGGWATRLLQAAGLLALLLTLGLPRARAGNQTAGQAGAKIRCYVCEREGSFACGHEMECGEHDKFCNLVAAKVYPRYYYVSKQCAPMCTHVMPVIKKNPKTFLMEKPMPFFYMNCCKGSLCNANLPPGVDESVFREQTGRASVRSHGHAALTVLMASITTFTGLCLL